VWYVLLAVQTPLALFAQASQPAARRIALATTKVNFILAKALSPLEKSNKINE
jgi:hypothetical protein